MKIILILAFLMCLPLQAHAAEDASSKADKKEKSALFDILYSPVAAALITVAGTIFVGWVIVKKVEKTRASLQEQVERHKQFLQQQLEVHRSTRDKLLELYTHGQATVKLFHAITHLVEPINTGALVKAYSTSLVQFARYLEFQNTCGVAAMPQDVSDYVEVVNGKFSECFLAISKSPESRKQRKPEIEAALADISSHLDGLKTYAEQLLGAVSTTAA